MAQFPIRSKPAILAAAFLLLTGCFFQEPEPAGVPLSPYTGVAFIITSTFAEGSYSTIDISSLEPFINLGLQMIHSDASGRYFPLDGNVYVSNRLGKDNIQVLNPFTNFQTEKEISTGSGSNPHDIALISTTKAYVTRYNSGSLWIINPASGIKTGEIDLSSFAYPDNTGQNSGIPHMDRIYFESSAHRAFISLQRLRDDWHPSPYSSVLVIDTDTDTVVEEIKLQWDDAGTVSATNPYSDFRYVPSGTWQPAPADGHDHLMIACTGEFSIWMELDCGIIAIDMADLECENGYILSETDTGTEIVDFEIKSASSGYAVTTFIDGSDFRSGMIRFDPGTGTVTSTILENTGDFGQIGSLRLHSSGKLFLCDRNAVNPGIRVYDTDNSDTPLNDNEPVYVGMPPDSILFVE